MPLLLYIRQLTPPRLILWAYAAWYAVTVTLHFDPRPRLWLTSLGLSGIVGLALLLSTMHGSQGRTRLDRWQIFRLFLMPFCVSSFAALVKDAGFILIFPPTLRENLLGATAIAALLGIVRLVKALPAPGVPAQGR